MFMKQNKLYILLGIAIAILIGAIVLYFKCNVYTVRLYSDGELIETIEARRNRPLKEPKPLTKDGYMFIGWYQEDGELFNFENNITRNINLTAGWGLITTEENQE